MSDRALTELESFLRTGLAAPLPGPRAQWKFVPTPAFKGWQPDDQPDSARAAAALILIYPGEHGPSFPLTVRRDDMRHHAGQISLPGGRVDPGEDPAAAAVREAHEEIGVDPDSVRVVGALSSLWVVVSNHVLRPFVGITDERPDFRAHPAEVASLIETPVAWVRDRSRVGSEQRMRGGILVDFPYFDFDGHRVWGATAMMLGELREVLDGYDR